MVRALLLAALAAGAAARPDLLHGKGADWIKWLAQNAKKVVEEKIEAAAPEPVFPDAWGPPPEMYTEDYVPLAGGYGHGSSTISAWISRNINRDMRSGKVNYPPAFGEPPFQLTRDAARSVTDHLVMLPFGYGRGSGTTARWLKEKAKEVYGEDADEFRPALPRPPSLHVPLPAQPAARPGAKMEFPASWGFPPMAGTMDYVPLAGGYGHGSSTLSKWIQHNIQADKEQRGRVQYPPAFGEPPRMQTRDIKELPFGYGHGSGTIARWLMEKASEVYNEDAREFMGHAAVHGGPPEDVFSI